MDKEFIEKLFSMKESMNKKEKIDILELEKVTLAIIETMANDKEKVPEILRIMQKGMIIAKFEEFRHRIMVDLVGIDDRNSPELREEILIPFDASNRIIRAVLEKL